MSIPILPFGLAASLVCLLDQTSTYWFVVPSIQLYNDPGRLEHQRILKFLMRRYGVPNGQILYAPVEILVLTALMSFVYWLIALTPYAGWAFRIGLLCPLVDLAIVFPYNFRLGRRLRAEVANHS